MSEEKYPGGELELFAQAAHWKRYVAKEVGGFVGSRVLEVGAGIGGTTRLLCGGQEDEWVCLEPDPDHARLLQALIDRGELPSSCTVRCGTLDDLEPERLFDTVLYVDVLEHILDDARELRSAVSHLDEGGNLVVLSPAHQWLFSPFDAAIGHHRRYTEQSLRRAAPDHLELVRLRYLDSVGLLASLANRVALKQSVPTLREIRIWDRIMVRASGFIDPMLGYRLGKSVLAVWRRRA